MLYRALADFVVVIHAAFVLFVIFGGLLVLRSPRLTWLHLPAAVWGILIEFAGWTCPLTPLENALRLRGGEAGYSAGFIEHYVLPALYPTGLTRNFQIVLGSVVLVFNLAVYAMIIARQRAATMGP